MVYEMDDATMRHLVDAKVESQLTRAMRYVESIDARAVVPRAGPPCFLDPDAVPPQRHRPATSRASSSTSARSSPASTASGHHGVLAIPGTTIDVGPDGDLGARTRSPTTR